MDELSARGLLYLLTLIFSVPFSMGKAPVASVLMAVIGSVFRYTSLSVTARRLASTPLMATDLEKV